MIIFLKETTTSRFLEDRESMEKSKQVHQDYLRLNADSFLALLQKDIKDKLQKKKTKITTVPHLSHFLKKNLPQNDSIKKMHSSVIKTEPRGSRTEPRPSILGSENKRNSIILQGDINNNNNEKQKNISLTERKATSTFTKRDQLLKDYINYQEDLDFFVKSNYLNETGLFLSEISKLENFNDEYISRNIENLTKNDTDFLSNLPSLQAKIKYENLKREYEEKKKLKFTEKKKITKPDERYYEIKRNLCAENNNNDLQLHDMSEDDTSLPSLTEATLDNLYAASLEIQKKILKKKDSGFAPRIRQFLKLEEISK